jgi:hypothetical protein
VNGEGSVGVKVVSLSKRRKKDKGVGEWGKLREWV